MHRSIIILLLSFFITISGLAQIRLDDPNTIFKNKEGKVLTKEEVYELVSKGPVSITKTLNGDKNGKTIIVISLVSESKIKEDNIANEKHKKRLTNQPLSNFIDAELKDVHGNIITRNSLLGEVTVLNFWFIKCKPCVREIPDLNKLVEKYPSINFIAPAYDQESDLKTFLQKTEFKYNVIPDASKLCEKLNINTFPTHIVVDKKGIIRDIFIGASEEMLQKISTSILKIREE